MANISSSSFLFCLLVFVLVASTSTIEAQVTPATPTNSSRPFNRTLFPADFIFGAGSAAYQIEGGAYIDGKGPSFWDTYTKNHPERIFDGSNGDVAADFYHKYMDDIKLMKEIGLDSFRFSISWTRVLPTGRVSGGVNPLGVQFYTKLIKELLHNGIVPFVTIFHWDVPQALEDEYGGFRNSSIVKDFEEYADFLFKTFGHLIKNWCTVNEPSVFSVIGYDLGNNAPGRCSDYIGNCLGGDSATEPYIVGHNLLLAHAAAVNVYKLKYQELQKGKIGITIVSGWFVPKFNTQSSYNASIRAQDFNLGWFLDPLTFGDYPKIMRDIIGDRMPVFNNSESASLIGSFDFLGINYYSANYAEVQALASGNYSYYVDIQTNLTTEKNGVSLGTPTTIEGTYSYPKGLLKLLLYIKNKYNNPLVYITENGVGDPNTLSYTESIKDGIRIRFLHDHISAVLESIKQGANVKAYYIWTFLDDFEWAYGYTKRYGIIYINFKTLGRHLKYSAYWFKNFLSK